MLLDMVMSVVASCRHAEERQGCKGRDQTYTYAYGTLVDPCRHEGASRSEGKPHGIGWPIFILMHA